LHVDQVYRAEGTKQDMVSRARSVFSESGGGSRPRPRMRVARPVLEEDEHGAGPQPGFTRPGDRRGAGGPPSPARGRAVQGWDRDRYRLGWSGSADGGANST